MMTTKRPWTRHMAATPIAVLQVGWSGSRSSSSSNRSVSSRRKKTRNRTRLDTLGQRHVPISPCRYREGTTHITAKQTHCVPICAIPSKPAVHSKGLTSLQQATSARDWGSVRMFPNWELADVTPSRTKYGDMPSEEPREMIR